MSMNIGYNTIRFLPATIEVAAQPTCKSDKEFGHLHEEEISR